MGLSLATAPATEPVTLSEAKLHLRVDVSDDDTLITALIIAARRMAEQHTGRALVTQEWVYTLDAFPVAEIILPLPQLVSVDVVNYIDENGADQVLAGTEYDVFKSGILGMIAPAYDKTWPATRDNAEAVAIEFTCGFGNAAAVPQEIKQWMLLQIGHWYSCREAVAQGNFAKLEFVDSLIEPYRVNLI
jgi:uncharacterized phiE125 gp8 family phage protein